MNTGASTSGINSTSECTSTVQQSFCVDKNAPHYAINYQNMVRIRDSTESEEKLYRATKKKQYRHPKYWQNKYTSYADFVANHDFFKQKNK